MEKQYRVKAKQGDPQVRLQIPADIYSEILKFADKNKRAWKEELIARLAAALRYDEFIMESDRIMNFIRNRAIAVKRTYKVASNLPKSG